MRLSDLAPPALNQQKNINNSYLSETLFIIPANDGEAVRANQILVALDAPYHHISRQQWGALIDNEWCYIDKALLNKVKRAVVFEMPGKGEPGTRVPMAEQRFFDLGIHLEVIDHHHYSWVDRYQERSSLEQLCEKIGWQMDEVDQAIAVNDRSHVPGLKKMGYSPTKIRDVRFFDLKAQGYSREYVQRQIKLVHGMLGQLQKARIDNLWVLDSVKAHSAVILQELAIKQIDKDEVVNVFEARTQKLGFSGNPRVVDLLLGKDFSCYGYQPGYGNYGGGDPTLSKFWGFKPAQTGESISKVVRDDVLKIIVDLLARHF